MPGFDQDQAGWIEAERVEAVTVRAAAVGEAPSRGNEQHRPRWRHAAKQGDHEPEGGRQVACRLGHHLVQRPEGKAAQRQVRIEGGQPEREGTPVGAHALQLRELATQGGYRLGSALMSFEGHGLPEVRKGEETM
jgi:hypothetical protein